MKSVISQLYYGEICPCEKPAPNTKRFAENRNKICNTEEKLIELYPDCKELLNEYTDALRIEAQLESEADFTRGLKLGVKLTAEILQNIDE